MLPVLLGERSRVVFVMFTHGEIGMLQRARICEIERKRELREEIWKALPCKICTAALWCFSEICGLRGDIRCRTSLAKRLGPRGVHHDRAPGSRKCSLSIRACVDPTMGMRRYFSVFTGYNLIEGSWKVSADHCFIFTFPELATVTCS